ncbi:MAG: GSU2403 family nucleotidyltransferase fold protein [Hyphomicrobiaceae bacterium]
MKFWELSHEQSRQYIDARQVFEAWRQAASQTWNARNGRYTTWLSWEKGRNGREYLVRRKGHVKSSLGPRSIETETEYETYTRERDAVIARQKETFAELRRMAPVNRALGLGRVPKLVAAILRRLDEYGFLGEKVSVIGTHSLYCYEAMCAVQIHSSLLATRDADFLYDSHVKLQLAVTKLGVPALIGILREADKSFDAGPAYGYYAVNRAGFQVEFMSAGEDGDAVPSGLEGDTLNVNPYGGLAGLLVPPQAQAVAIDETGMPVRMVAPSIVAFAKHKEWLSQQQGRAPEQRPRDREQAKIVRALATTYLGLDVP